MTLAIIGGTGALDLLETLEHKSVDSPWGMPSAALCRVDLGRRQAWFLARHGNPHHIPPHRINYRANIDVLRSVGVTTIVAINAVGGIDPDLEAGSLVLPDQLIDYTWGREHTFSDDAEAPLEHIEFGEPFAGAVRKGLLEAAHGASIKLIDGGCCAVTQGPRLETAAEVRRLANDGCSLVGMTTMPEAALAREARLNYASLCVVANPAAGVGAEPISIEEIHAVLIEAMKRIRLLLRHLS